MEKMVAAVTLRTVLFVLDVSDGSELLYSGNSEFSCRAGTSCGDGSVMGVEPAFDANGKVDGFVTHGIQEFLHQNDGGGPCNVGDGCKELAGHFTKWKPDFSGKIWTTKFNTGEWPGGKYQMANAQIAPKVLLMHTFSYFGNGGKT